jgi:pantetheine-phosphate adenylyltransferase
MSSTLRPWLLCAPWVPKLRKLWVRKALYAGSFDPITLGHANIIEKARRTFDEVLVGVGINPRKTRTFSVEESMDFIRATMEELNPKEPFEYLNVKVGRFSNSIAQYARQMGCTHIVRGLRQASDFNDEFIIRGALEHMDPDITLVHFICDHQFMHVSSSTARDLARLGHDPEWLVGRTVGAALRGTW